MFGKTKQSIRYGHQISGTWGEFFVAASRVSYLQTKARVGKSARDDEKRLVSELRPVREVLPTSTMDFNQLLQRDLDDHRVAASLVRYILQPASGRPVYFPPIVAALLPFEGKSVAQSFPSKTDVAAHADDNGIAWAGYQFGTAFKFEKIIDSKTGEDFDIKVGKLSWNAEESKLVVIDGQHRAMALLAIDRTLNNTWADSGEKYKYFYEPVINELVAGLSDEQRTELISRLEFPVNIIWFPDSNDVEPKHHEVARRLFVDINKNARTPSESRILLLSDNDLLSIFTRALLNKFRVDDAGLPIYAVEYDHPGRDQASSSKWSAVTNVIVLRDAISRSVFGPKKYVENMDARIGSRESPFRRAEFMRETLRIEDEIPEVMEGMTREEVCEEKFPREYLDFLQRRLVETWGLLVFRILSEISPYKDHGAALKELKSGWATAGSTDTLAKDAVFEGVGMYWTIRDAYLHWESENRLLESAGSPKKGKTDIVRTWDVLNAKAIEFRCLRAKIFLGKQTEEVVGLADAAFDVYSTNACQVGLVLAIRSVVLRCGLGVDELPTFFDRIISAINVALSSGPDARYGRKLFVSKTQPGERTPRLNVLPKLDTPLSVYFRYFWLELLATPEGASEISSVDISSAISDLRDLSRRHYLKYVTDINEKAIKAQHPSRSVVDVKRNAAQAAEKSLAKALKFWFDVGDEAWNAWVQKPVVDSDSADLPEGLDEADVAALTMTETLEEPDPGTNAS